MWHKQAHTVEETRWDAPPIDTESLVLAMARGPSDHAAMCATLLLEGEGVREGSAANYLLRR